MPRKKRATVGSPIANRVKRRKMPASQEQGGAATATVDLTAHNAAASPLLRLPAELRDEIWKLVFSNKMICVHSSHRGTKKEDINEDDDIKLYYLAYDTVCDHPWRSDAWRSEMTDEAAQSQITPQLVCRQFWAETSRAFLLTCTFRVNSPNEFRALATSAKPIVAQIHRLMIHSSGYKSHNFPMYWQDVFNSALVGRFVSLEGLRITGKVYWGPENGVQTTDVMEGSHWKMIKLSKAIQSFQQHKLRAELTSVVIEPYCYEHEPPWVAEPINEAIRENLLQYRPRRLSKRGT